MGGERRGQVLCLQRAIPFLALLLAAVASAAPALSADTVTRTLFGPETFRKSSGTSFTRTFTVPATQGTFNLRLVNGDGAGSNAVSSGTVKVNGTTVVKSSDLNQNVRTLDKPLTNLKKGSNALVVTISSNSSPSSYLTISITGAYLLDIDITSPPAGAEIHSDKTAVGGTYASYTSSVTISVNGVAATFSGGTFSASNVPLVPGANTLTAVITTVDGIQDNDAISLSSNRPPVANAGADRNVLTGDRVTLDGRNSYDPEGDLITYAWSLLAAPAGSVAALDNPSSVLPSFTPDLPGTYVSSLTVSDGHSNSLPDNVSVFAQRPNVPPTANAGPDQSVVTGTVVQLDGRGSFDPESATLSWSWQMLSRPAGSTAVLDYASTPLPTFLADVSGQYVVRLTVNDGQVDSAPDNVAVVAAVPNAAPVAFAGPDNTVSRNAFIRLDGTQSYDPDNDPLFFAWSIVSRPAGGTSALDNAASPTPSMPADGEGDFVFRLVVNDGQVDSAPDTVVVTSVNDPPVANAGPDQGVTSGTTVSLDGSGSTDGNGDPLGYSWSLVSVPAGSAAALSASSTAHPTFVPDVAGQYVVRLAVSDGWAASAPDDVTVTAWPPILPVPSVLGMTQAQAQSTLVASGLAVGVVTTGYSDTVAAGRVMSQTPTYGSPVSYMYPVDFVVSAGPIPLPIPPDPATVAPPVPQSVATTVAASTEFLYTGSEPIQRDVLPGTIDPKRAAVVRGAVRTRDGAPLPGVAVTVLNRPEFGRTLSRADGMYDMAVNGGGEVTLNYTKPDHMTVHQRLDIPTNGFTNIPDVVLLPYDNQVTSIILGASSTSQVARGNPVSDSHGVRQATLIFPSGTSANLVLSDGSERPISSMGVRATEYTVGPSGPAAMPAPLPPTSGYTYAVELSADEAVAAGAETVRFDRPVSFYVDNFIGLPPGTNVPVGFYDRSRGVWVPSKNGKVVKIMSITGGMADLDTDGDGMVDDAGTLNALNITDQERTQLAVLYPPGRSMWRAPLSHFTPYDCNFPAACIDNSTGSPVTVACAAAEVSKAKTESGPGIPCPDTPNIEKGSIIKCEPQTLGESIRIAGTPFSLYYGSDRVSGRRDGFTMHIPLSGDTIPPGLKRIDLEVHISGKVLRQSYPAIANQTETYTWDGRDVFGRTLQGAQKAFARVGYVYDMVYILPGVQEPVFAVAGDVWWGNPPAGPAEGFLARSAMIRWLEQEVSLGNWDARGHGLGGWTLDVHHFYDFGGGILHSGDGGSRSASDVGAIITTVAGSWYGSDADGIPATQANISIDGGLIIGADGSMYFTETYRHRIRRIGPDGIISTVAGNGSAGYSGDGGPALQASLNYPRGLALGPDGSLFIADRNNNRIRRVTPDGIIDTVAGNGVSDYQGDGGPATQASLDYPNGVAAAPDGSFYITDSMNMRIRRVGTDGTIQTVSGTGAWGFSGDLGPAIFAWLQFPLDIVAGADGSLYIVDSMNGRIRRVSPDGVISTVAGNGIRIHNNILENCRLYSGDGGPAVLAAFGYDRLSLAASPDGSIYIGDSTCGRVRRVGPDGIITTVAGGGDPGSSGDGNIATRVWLGGLSAVSVGPDRKLYLGGGGYIRKVASNLPGYSAGDIAIASGDGDRIYTFNASGLHRNTVSALTGTTLYTFDHDPTGLLVSVTDADNNVTRIERDTYGKPGAIAAPGGQRTVLDVDGNGFLTFIADPGGDNVALSHRADGLLEWMRDPREYLHTFQYDPFGRLTRDDDPAGGFKSLSRSQSQSGNGYVVNLDTAMGRRRSFQVSSLPGGISSEVVTSPSGAVESIQTTDGGVNTTVYPDNTTIQVVSGPDPRFGMQAPFAGQTTVSTPGGLVSYSWASRNAYLAVPTDPFSLIRTDEARVTNGRSYQTLYESATRTFTFRTPGYRTSVKTVDERGRATSFQADNAARTATLPVTISYDGQGHLHQMGQGANLWTYLYDSRNRLQYKIDPLDNTVEYGYDDADRVNMVRLPSGRTYRFVYDAGGNRTQVVMPDNNVHLLGYTPVNLDNSYVPPGNPSYSHSYSLDREWTRTTLPSGREISAGYDPVSAKLLAVSYPEGAVGYGYADNTDRVFDLTRTGTDLSVQRIDYAYDGFLATKAAFSGASTGEYRYAYDNNFWTTGVALDNAWTLLSRDNDGLLTGYGPFTFGRGGPAGAPDNASDLVPRNCGLDNAGLPVVCPPGTLALQYGYDAFGRVNRRTQTVNGIPVYEAYLERDAAGRISRKTETVAGSGSTYEYIYDVDGQLSEVRKSLVGTVERYGYDPNGNRNRTLALAEGDFAYDPQDRLERMGSISYEFDPDGFLATRGPGASNRDTFTYSARGELLSATAGGQTITYAYDGTARRVARTNSAGTTQYLYGNLSQPFQITASRNPDNVLTVYYYDDYGALYALERGGVRYYVGSDHLGTPKVITDNSGTIVRQVEYDSWGVKTGDTNPGFDLPVGFAGGIPDDATGLVRFGFRDYEPGTGRWAAKDPIFFEGGQANLFVYVANDPINTTDPSGLRYCDFNVTIPLSSFFGLTAGVLWTPDGKAYFYVGGGAMTGPGASLTWSPNDPTPGWNGAVQGGRNGGTVQIGIDNKGKLFVEGGVGTPGASGTVFKVYGPYDIPRRR